MLTRTEAAHEIGEWQQVGGAPAPSWYLDPLVAAQKREVHQELIRRWTRDMRLRRVLKTDLFEEANGADAILFDLFPPGVAVIGCDIAESTVVRARGRAVNGGLSVCVCDVRQPAVRTSSLDLVISTSTLDHFDAAADIETALRQLAATLRPGGRLIVTLDNPRNPLYGMLRWYSRTGRAPFRLGETMSAPQLRRALERAGLRVVAEDVLIHNPRLISTALILALRRLAGAHADGFIAAILRAFAALGRLPTRGLTGCFVAACAMKSEDPCGI